MNKKILAGLTGIVVAGAFWACGSGEINEPTMEDTVVQNLFSDLDQQESFKKDAYDRCRKDPTCADRIAAVDVPAQPSSSSETVSNGGGTSAPVIAASSSSANIIINNNPSSSSPVIVDPASSGSEDTPAQPVTGLGSCAPEKTPINKGETASWKFTFNTSNPNGVKPIDVSKSGKFDWTFTGAEPGTETVEKKMTSSAVTYANSGSYEASVTVAVGTATETIKCAPLQVNGDPITGCECGTAATSVDYTATPDVAWAVTGCKSASEISYEWEGAAGTDSFTKTFDAATAGYAPKLKVKNSDNTAIDVTCPAVKVTEGAEYVLKLNKKIYFKSSGKYVVSLKENSSISSGCSFNCNNGGNWKAVVGSTITLSGPYYASCSFQNNNGNPQIQRQQCEGDISLDLCKGSDIDIEITGIAAGDSLECSGGWW